MEESFPRDSGGTAAPPGTPHGGGAELLSQATADPRYPQAGPHSGAGSASKKVVGAGLGAGAGPQGAHAQPRSPPFLLSEQLKEQAEKDKGKRGEWRALRPHLRLAEAGR